MEWLIKLIKRLFYKEKIKLIEAPKTEDCQNKNIRDNFLVNIKQTADLECDDRNGYKIIKRTKLKDMV